MVEDYLSEDEQAEALKSWWKDNWIWVLSGIALGLAILGGWQFYQRSKTHRAEAASTALVQYAGALTSNDTAKAESALKEIDEKYASTPYWDQAYLLRARVQVEAGQFDEAAITLRSVAEKSKDAELSKVANLRLARVLVQQQKYDDALKLLDAGQAGAFVGQVHEVRGDVYYAKGDVANARTEYQAALAAASGETAVNRSLLELKLQDLGEPASETPSETPNGAAPKGAATEQVKKP